MTYVITEPCIQCRYTDCVEVCPTNCIYIGKNFSAIDPADCIDCGACEPVCPVQAIKLDTDLPEDMKEYIALNAQLYSSFARAYEKLESLPEADAYTYKTDKRHLLKV